MWRTVWMASVALCVASSGCDDPPPTTRADAVTAAPTASSAPAPAPTAPPKNPAPKAPRADAPPPVQTTAPTASAAPATTLAQFGSAAKVKLRRFGETGGVSAEAELTDPESIAALIAAIDVGQAPSEDCPRCIASVQLIFHDAFATRLGTMGLACRGDDPKDLATVRDALADQCTSIRLKDAAAVLAIVDQALGT